MEKFLVKVFDNDIFKVAVKLENDEWVFDAENVAKCLGFIGISTKSGGKKYEWIRWDRVNEYLSKYFSQDIGKGDFIPESAVYKLAFKASNDVAEQFQDWLAIEVLPKLRKEGTYSIGQININRPSISYIQQLEGCKFIANDLNVNEASKLLMYEKVCEANRVDTAFLPKYELNGSRQLKAPTQLLKEYGVKISAVKFNRELIELGYIEERKRKSSKGNDIKKFKALTQKGLKFGENAINPHNQKEVQPLYYTDTFLELVSVVEGVLQ